MEREANRIKIENLIATGNSNNVLHEYILEYISLYGEVRLQMVAL